MRRTFLFREEKFYLVFTLERWIRTTLSTILTDFTPVGGIQPSNSKAKTWKSRKLFLWLYVYLGLWLTLNLWWIKMVRDVISFYFSCFSSSLKIFCRSPRTGITKAKVMLVYSFSLGLYPFFQVTSCGARKLLDQLFWLWLKVILPSLLFRALKPCKLLASWNQERKPGLLRHKTHHTSHNQHHCMSGWQHFLASLIKHVHTLSQTTTLQYTTLQQLRPCADLSSRSGCH